MIERKTVSQCVSSDYCKGYNTAVDEFEEYKGKCLKEISNREKELKCLIETHGEQSYIVSKAYNILVGIKIAYRIVFESEP